jgi:hypothetical protein
MLPVGFESTISAGERPQTYTLDRAATGTGYSILLSAIIQSLDTTLLQSLAECLIKLA